MNQLDIAREYIAAGISVVPIRLDGSKAAAVPWKEYQDRLATDEELQSWFSRKSGIGIVCGAVSGGLEVLDFDDGSIFWDWFDAIPDVACKLAVVETPKDGYHVLYRCDVLGGNQKIAMQADGKKVRIETRGEGGYIVGAGSPLGVHPIKERTYVQILGNPLPEIPTITGEERRRLWQVGARFDLRKSQSAPVYKPKRSLMPPSEHGDGHPVIEKFKAEMTWPEVLPGWTSHDGIHWTRPGKNFGISASMVTATDGTEVLYIFTTSTGLQSDHCYNKFEAFKNLIHNGDGRAAFQAAKEKFPDA
jgi:putative DNA primase/helicase